MGGTAKMRGLVGDWALVKTGLGLGAGPWSWGGGDVSELSGL